jgi:hypothetical protein
VFLDEDGSFLHVGSAFAFVLGERGSLRTSKKAGIPATLMNPRKATKKL